MGVLKKARPYLKLKTRTLLYQSLIPSYIDYWDLIDRTATQENLNRLQVLQNMASHIVLYRDITNRTFRMHVELDQLVCQMLSWRTKN